MVSNIYFRLSADHELMDFVWAALGVEVFMLVFFFFHKVYDLSTAMFISFGLGMLAREKFHAFYALFTIACLNRETMLLLTIVFAVFFLWRLQRTQYLFGLIYQAAAFLGTRFGLMILYADNPGRSAHFWLWRVLRVYASHLFFTVVLIGLCILLGCLIARGWNRKPILLRYALLLMFPLQLVLHLLFGMAFEIRVFAELFPVLWVLLRDENKGIRKQPLPRSGKRDRE
jgi:hypothetical protein